MPKKATNLWKDVIDFGNLVNAFNEASKGKKENASVLRFQSRLEENVIQLQNQLIWKMWEPSKYREFVVKEPKLRLIQAPEFKDRVLHHSLHEAISCVFEKKFIKDSYACRVGKGTHLAVKRVQAFLKKQGGNAYILKGDISKYFQSINHDILLNKIARYIKDDNCLWLCSQLIKKSGYELKGIPLGALTSQLFANAYLDTFDHYIKDELGIKYYVRYMDDFIVVSGKKDYLSNLLKDIESFLMTELSLSLNPKTTIFASKNGVDFAGYRIWSSHLLPRKSIIKRSRKKLKVLQKKYSKGTIGLEKTKEAVCSLVGYAKHCDSRTTIMKILEDFVLTRRSD